MHHKRWVDRVLMTALVAPAALPVAAGSVFVISDDPSLTEIVPSVAHNSTDKNFLVVWFNDRPGNDDIRAQRVTNNGSLQGPAFYVSAGAGADRRYPDVAYNRRLNEYLAVWQEYHWAHIAYDIYARRLTAGGVLLGSDFSIQNSLTGDPAVNPAVAGMPPFGAQGQYLEVCGFDGTQVMGRFVSGDGTPDPYEVRFGTDYYDSNPAIAGQEATQSYLVSWSRPADPPLAFKYIFAQTVSSSGDFWGNEWLVGGLSARNSAVAAAVEPGLFLIVFDDIDSGAATRGIYGASWDFLFADGFEYGDTSTWSSSVP